ncbi:enoyl-CoA hydratase/isomerase family protein [Mycolicibacterium flavescens]|uniref:Enoyl-CoA hydratase n=1 Tax=Mycolicibacterium flavescens TaxID=1776 RepID=A0A1E3RNG0_MYCFV|nr:enoyl-CoA hydratase/isomerase family protein [Mycolicibacterium flavescens]MCV7278137.1 enoyl-CoA hydratase/isomerase family protein [Mycolicibacterium flavescens]ODQ91408.1 enoyl-CoA hydratase [Mycolicibacterium flavescens]
MTAPAIEQRDEGKVRTLTLNRPDRLNAFTASSYQLLASMLDDAAAADDVAVVLLTGAGRAFCSGVDLSALSDAEDRPAEFGDAFDTLLENLLALPKPLVAAVHGVAVGIGFTLLLHCDVVLVADDTRLRAPFTQLGTAPEAGSSWLLPQVVGAQRAAELILTSRWLEAGEAVDWGLATESCSPDTLHQRARELAHEIAAHAPAATRAAKRLLLHDRTESVRAALRRERGAATELLQLLGPIARKNGPSTTM